jgi:phenylalanyl-tRNA synthetase beta subunit
MTVGHKRGNNMKHVKAKSIKAAAKKAPKNKVVTNVNLIDKTRGRKMKTYSLTLKNRDKKSPKRHK